MTHRTEYTATEARDRFSDVFDAAHHGFIVTIKKGSRKVAVVPMSLVERVLALEDMAPGPGNQSTGDSDAQQDRD